MREYTAKVSKDGRIVIPVACREELHIKPGDALIIRVAKNELRMTTVASSLKRARQLLSKRVGNKSLVKELKKMRKEDLKNE